MVNVGADDVVLVDWDGVTVVSLDRGVAVRARVDWGRLLVHAAQVAAGSISEKSLWVVVETSKILAAGLGDLAGRLESEAERLVSEAEDLEKRSAGLAEEWKRRLVEKELSWKRDRAERLRRRASRYREAASLLSGLSGILDAGGRGGGDVLA